MISMHFYPDNHKVDRANEVGIVLVVDHSQGYYALFSNRILE